MTAPDRSSALSRHSAVGDDRPVDRTGGPREIELKLELAPVAGQAILASGMFGEDGRVTALRATYFDTADHALHRHGHTLRIREGDGTAVQTVKTGAIAAGLFSRGEWELPVVGGQPAADRRTPVADLLATRLDDLVPLFDVPVRRRSWRLQRGGADIEVVLDHGEAVADDRLARFCEIELELHDGPSGALFDLAREIDVVAPVRIGVLSKAERGYRLLGPLPDASGAENPLLAAETPLPEAFAAIAGACLRQYRLNEAILLERYHPKAVHQARVGLRRLRSAMTLFKAMFASPAAADFNVRIRELASVLGEARDLDVLCAMAEPGPLQDRLNRVRATAHAAVERQLASRDARLLPLDLSEWLATGDWRADPATLMLRETPLPVFAAGALDRLRHKTARHGRHLAALDPDARHRLRKDAKKLRYAVEFLGGLFDEKRRHRAFVRALQALQDELGALNDRATAEARLASLGLLRTPEADRLLSRWKIRRLLDDAAKARHALLEVKPFWR